MDIKGKLIITIGLPASGKSTWAHEWVKANSSKRVRVNRDDIRNMLGPYWVPYREDLVTEIEESMVINAMFNTKKLDYKFDIVLDATNFKHSKWLRIASYYGYEVEINSQFLEVPLEECIRRDKLREAPVGEYVIRGMYEKYIEKRNGNILH